MADNAIKESSIKKNETGLKVVIYIVSVIFAIMTLFPFVIMITNSFRSTFEIQQSTLGMVSAHPFQNLAKNWNEITNKEFHPLVGFKNSFIISTLSTILNVYFSSLTAYAISAYEWKLRDAFNNMIVGIMMVPGTVTTIGFVQIVYKLGLSNKLFLFIIPAIASPMTVFFMRQYLQASLSMEIVQSARIDGAGEFRIFNQIVVPLMKPAIATQAIFGYVASWNNLFMPLILLTETEKKTIPVMVKLLNGDIYRREYGAIYLGLLVTVLPLIVVYAFLSRFIVEGVALGGVKS
ncbi:carbohydrate ABC transporter permease [Butyrivibrio sp. AE2032]|uniref:carbohydrate ABC transporter permease n=1 Tax=Butyrivibrio sp. AE2032 TaxID=1458463 RepID=UPI000552731B|nr:carbohydrate ABC transporter permease [Butyrivibrio sp. AE2032]